MSVARIEEAFLLVERGEMAPAADVLQRVTAEAPGYAPAYVLYAKVCETLHRWPEALALWQDAALLIPTLDVAREGVLRATRVIAALQALDARTAARAETAPPPPAPAESDRDGQKTPPSPPPPPAAAPVEAIPLPLTPPAERDTPPAEPPRTPPQTTPSAIRLGAPPPPTEEAPTARPAAAPAEEAPSADAPPRAPLSGAAFDAPPPPPDVFGRETPEPFAEEAPAGEAPFDAGLDLDALIDQLNTQGRIRPRQDLDKIPAPDLEDDIEDMVSETLARIYATQGQYDEAARIYELLAAQHPEQADEFMDQAAMMRARAGD